MNPEEILTRDALTKPHRTVIDRSQVEQSQIRQLTMALKQQMIKEIRESYNKEKYCSIFQVTKVSS
jgi:transcription termination factor Rho